ncbi:MAG: DNA gyrase subunit A [Bacteroidia bacterium]|nr:DNA gyrase subunit A [Bacteroidia bacterium]MDW8235312.1 DNA gyrase subunit A [Bacteroidia bacterium]
MSQVIERSIVDEMRSAYIDYAMSVIVARALPDVRDGLKPVQRRVLYGMLELGLTPDKPYKKSARIVGEVLGKYHPHGDAAVYDTMVRMAQEWTLRYPLVEGQGNFGSMDDDAPAAMRYTEARLAAISLTMLEDLEKNTVDFIPNFDESLQEPTVLPALLPNLLLNGASGIAVGMATEIPPHNLSDVVRALILLLENPTLSDEALIEAIQGPDFPTGGMILGKEGIRQMYLTGRGRLRLRGKAFIDTLPGGKTAVIITEIPYRVSKASLVEQIAHLAENKKIEGIAEVRDESDREGVRVVVELKRDATPRSVLNSLYMHTMLEISYNAYWVGLYKGRPRMLNLRDALTAYLEHRNQIVLRRTAYDLEQAEKRAHILEGLLIALAHLDAIIALIRGSRTPEEAKNGLIQQFNLTPVQAQAILDLRLQRLTALEREKIQAEHTELLERIAYYRKVLQDPAEQRAIIQRELQQLDNTHGDARRTQIASETGEITLEDTLPNASAAILISHQGYIKRTDLSAYRSQGRGGSGVRTMELKDEDFIQDVLIAHLRDYLLLFTQKGHCYWLKVHDIPEAQRAQKGRHIQNLLALPPDDRVVAYLNVPFLQDEAIVKQHVLLFATQNGMIKKTPLQEYTNVRSKGIIAVSIREGDHLVKVLLVNEQKTKEIIMVSAGGQAIRFAHQEVRAMGRDAAGVIGMKLEAEDAVIALEGITPQTRELFVLSEFGYGKATSIEEYRITHRGGQGVRTFCVSSKTGRLVAALTLSDRASDMLLVTQGGQGIRFPAKEIPLLGRDTQGNMMIRLKEGDRVVSVSPIIEAE